MGPTFQSLPSLIRLSDPGNTLSWLEMPGGSSSLNKPLIGMIAVPVRGGKGLGEKNPYADASALRNGKSTRIRFVDSFLSSQLWLASS